MRHLLRIAGLSIILAVYYAVGVENSVIKPTWVQVVFNPVGSDLEMNTYILAKLLLYFAPLAIFQILHGNVMYRSFCTVGIYLFTRQASRARWFLKQSLQVLVTAFIFRVAMQAALFFILLRTNNLTSLEGGVQAMFYDAVIFTCLASITSILMNLLSIALSNGNGALIVFGAQAVCLGALTFWNGRVGIEASSSTQRAFSLLWINPIAHAVLPWQSSRNPTLDAGIRQLGHSHDLMITVVLVIAVLLVLTAIGVGIVRRQDILDIPQM